MAELQNKYFAESPLTARLAFTSSPDAEGWRGFLLTLYADTQQERVVSSCVGQLSDRDYEQLLSGLEGLAGGNTSILGYNPIESTFLLRGTKQDDGEIELLWVIDQGNAENDYSTDTGIGILMVVDSSQIEEFLTNLAQEPASTAD
jgi:hypothetical protein